MLTMTADEYREMFPDDERGSRYKKRRCPLESDEQMALFEWARLNEHRYPELALLVHIPNGGYRNKPEAMRFKAEGVKGGFPDVFLPVARGGYHGLMIEMKRLQGGRLSDAQREWIRALNGQGYHAAVCRGFIAAQAKIEAYMAGHK